MSNDLIKILLCAASAFSASPRCLRVILDISWTVFSKYYVHRRDAQHAEECRAEFNVRELWSRTSRQGSI